MDCMVAESIEHWSHVTPLVRTVTVNTCPDMALAIARSQNNNKQIEPTISRTWDRFGHHMQLQQQKIDFDTIAIAVRFPYDLWR